MYISTKDWKNYIDKMSKLNKAAADKIIEYVQKNGFGNTDDLIKYANAVVMTYGSGSAALAAAMYDATAEAAGAFYDPAEPAPLPEYGEVAKTVMGTLKRSQNVNEIAGAVSRLVKRTGADTTLQNAYRDRKKYGKKKNTGAQVAWVPMGDTCPFCLMLASNGWRNQTVGGQQHAEHIHANCDCNYAVRFNENSGVAGYDPDRYKEMFDDLEGDSWNEKVNAMRRKQYEKNKDRINAQKREAYAERVETKQNKTKIVDKTRVDNNSSNGTIKPMDVTEEYKKNAKPGIGKFIKDDGFIDVNGEENVAKWLYDTFGGDLRLLAANNPKGEKNPDYLWNNRLWDLKTISTEKAANSATRSGLKQIRINPGGIILTLNNEMLMNDDLYKVIDERMKWNKLKQVDIIVKNNEQYRVLRYIN